MGNPKEVAGLVRYLALDPCELTCKLWGRCGMHLMVLWQVCVTPLQPGYEGKLACQLSLRVAAASAPLRLRLLSPQPEVSCARALDGM